MRRILGWTAVVVLLCATSKAAAGAKQPDPRLSKARMPYEAMRLENRSEAELMLELEQELKHEEARFGDSHLEVAMRLLQHLRSEEEFLYALLRTYPGDASVRRLAISSVLLRKGRSVEETANTSRTIVDHVAAALPWPGTPESPNRQTHPHPYDWTPFIDLERDAPHLSLAPPPKE
ncbi:hypothetical protein [Archangium lipolyticum]|uniref:hypothetical protein n=1 Tax=Archangium lipolyticum TaxID=2970465 RepID=UPI00214A2C14|nr:hypothetical protein [Archangium lipolyticum]